jgi:hypothetical protein
MQLDAALLQHHCPLAHVTKVKHDMVLLFFGQGLVFFGNHMGPFV